MDPTILAFSLTGIIIIIGFISNYFFRKTGIPDIIILIFLGFLIGPVFKIINPDILRDISGILASLALLVILFDSGLNLKFRKVIKESPKALTLSFLNVMISMILAALFLPPFLNIGLLQALLIGAIVGGTSSSIVIPLISRVKINEKISMLLTLESAFTDAIVVVLGITIIQALSAPSGNEIATAAHFIASGFSIGALLGLILGVLWLRVLKSIRGEIYDDILTLSVAILFFGITEYLGGSGAIFALFFGLVLGNGFEILEFLDMEPFEVGAIMKKFQSQISFFIRTFFFVYIGLIISVANAVWAIMGIIFTFILFAGRYAIVKVLAYKDEILKGREPFISSVMPKGLAAAIIANFASKIAGLENVQDFVTIVIVVSVIIATVGVFRFKQTEKHHESSQIQKQQTHQSFP